VVGVFPALKSTGRGMQRSLQQLSSRGSQTHLGRTWTALIIGQVAVAVAILPTAAYFAGELTRRVSSAVQYPAHELLRARLAVELPDGMAEADSVPHDPAAVARFVARGEELFRRLRAEPGVTGVAFASQLPGYPFRRIETERGETQWAFIQQVSPDFFGVMDVRVAAGRDFVDADAQADVQAEARTGSGVIVNRVFAERVLGSGNVIGRRVRMLSLDNNANSGDSPERASGPWLEVIGVVPDFTTQGDLEPPHARLYTAATVATLNSPVTIRVRVRGLSPLVFASRLRELAAAVDPTLQLHDVRTAEDAERQVRRSLGLIAAAITAVVMSVVLLSAAGIYAMMSFTVVRRRREIGIRSALGADPRRLLASIFARAGGQLSVGVLIGLTLALVVQGPIEGRSWFLLPLVGVVMAVVGLVAAIGPARQGLAIPPTEALRDE
jgi:putative ABC transport system permease protein